MNLLSLARGCWSKTLEAIGPLVPFKARVSLSRCSPKFGYSLNQHGDFIIDDFLGTFRVRVNTRYPSERSMLGNRVEADVELAVREFVKPGATCVDIGANVGSVSFRLAKAVGTSGKVYCFEPGPPYFARLKDNVAMNPNYEKVFELFNVGFSKTEGSLYWAEDSDNPGNAGLLGQGGITVPVTTLDSVVKKRWPRLDFIKIDVEGMELEVMEGARETLLHYRPIVLYESLMEFESHLGSPIRQAVAQFLEKLGYELYSCKGKGKRVPAQYPNFSANTIAIPKAKA